MCVIIAKKKNGRLPSEVELNNCFKYNPDGAGFMYTLNNRVVIDKGYMDCDKFLKRFKYLCRRFNNFEDKALVIHCRIGTAGSNSPSNTHPYLITNNIDKLHATYIRGRIGIAHNGIISDYNPTINDTRDINDTQNFISTYLYSLYNNYKTFYKDKNMLDAIDYLTNSKFAILDANDELTTIGNFIELEDGLSFSNDSYASRVYTINSYDKWIDWYNDAYSWHDEDEKQHGRSTSHVVNYYDIPSNYFIEYDGEIALGDNYFINDDYELCKYDFELDAYNYITNDFTIYDDEFNAVELDEIIL